MPEGYTRIDMKSMLDVAPRCGRAARGGGARPGDSTSLAGEVSDAAKQAAADEAKRTAADAARTAVRCKVGGLLRKKSGC